MKLKLILYEVETNIVIAKTQKKSIEIVNKLAEKGIRASSFGDYKLRFVTHRDISMKEVEEACEIIKTFKI